MIEMARNKNCTGKFVRGHAAYCIYSYLWFTPRLWLSLPVYQIHESVGFVAIMMLGYPLDIYRMRLMANLAEPKVSFPPLRGFLRELKQAEGGRRKNYFRGFMPMYANYILFWATIVQSVKMLFNVLPR